MHKKRGIKPRIYKVIHKMQLINDITVASYVFIRQEDDKFFIKNRENEMIDKQTHFIV